MSEWYAFLSQLSEEDIKQWLDQYEALGPLPGILLPLIESFLPFLPIIVIIIGNALAYGLWKGFLFSWIGVVGGSFSIFLLTRRFAGRLSSYIQRKFPKGKLFFEWVEHKGFTPIFIMACMPFAPSFLVNIFAGLTRIAPMTFFLAILFGKSFMVFLISLVGYDLFSVLTHPWRLILAASTFLLIWIIGRWIEAHYRSKYEN